MPIIFFDTETTGLDRGSRMLSLAAIAVDESTYEEIDRCEWTVNPGMPVPPDVTKINGFTDETVKDAPPADQVLREFSEWVGKNRNLVGHYVSYDTGILTWEAGRAGIALPPGLLVLDTCEIARSLRRTKRNSLDALVEHYGIERCGEGHRAMSDADACLQYLRKVRATEHIAYEWTPWDSAGHDYAYTDALPDPLRHLPDLVAAGAPLTFRYEDKDGALTERTITPYGWAAKGDGVYFHGFCHLRQERRTFHVERVLSVLEAAA